MSSHYEAPIREPLVLGDKSYHDITVDIAKPIEGKANKNWYIAFTISLIAFLWGIGCIRILLERVLELWGLNKNIGWAWDITNFRLVGRYRSCRNLNFSSITFIPSKMENGN